LPASLTERGSDDLGAGTILSNFENYTYAEIVAPNVTPGNFLSHKQAFPSGPARIFAARPDSIPNKYRICKLFVSP
jgi:hypothetical protein